MILMLLEDLDRNPKVYREDKILFKYRKHMGSRDSINGKRWIEIKRIIENKDKAIFDKWNDTKNANNITQRQVLNHIMQRQVQAKGETYSNGRIPSKNPGLSNTFIRKEQQKKNV